MGIQGLLKECEYVMKDRYLSELKGLRVAVDGYVWLHRGIYWGASDLARGRKSTSHIKYFMNRVRQLLQYVSLKSELYVPSRHEMVVTVVFDGAPLPMKAATESERAKSRAVALERALELERCGDKAQAQTFFSRAVDVSPQMAFEVSEHLRKEGIDVLVAPYEADAQLGYLSQNGHIDFVVSEDSDLLVYCCKRVLYKLDFKTERGKEILWEDIFCNGSFSRLSKESFLVTAVLAGCDYLSSLNSIAMKTAIRIGAKAEGLLRSGTQLNEKGITSDQFLDKLITLIRLSGVDDFSIADDFKDQIRKALLTFRHQTVFCPKSRRLVPLNPTQVPLPFAGELYDAETACLVADCKVDPETKTPFKAQSQSDNEIPENREELKYRKRPPKRPREGLLPNPGKRLVDYWMPPRQALVKTGSAPDEEVNILSSSDSDADDQRVLLTFGTKGSPLRCAVCLNTKDNMEAFELPPFSKSGEERPSLIEVMDLRSVEPELGLDSLDVFAFPQGPCPFQKTRKIEPISLDSIDSLRFSGN
jgi:exonuclease-1